MTSDKWRPLPPAPTSQLSGPVALYGVPCTAPIGAVALVAVAIGARTPVEAFGGSSAKAFFVGAGRLDRRRSQVSALNPA